MALGPGFPIVIQSGISAGAPSTVGNIPVFSGGAPPDVLVDSILRQVTGPPAAIIVGTTDPESTSNETFRTLGGIVSEGAGEDSLVLGKSAAVGAATTLGAVAIGLNASVGATLGNLNDSMVVGAGSVANSPVLAASSAIVVFGPRNTVTSTGGQPADFNIVIGQGNSVTAPLGATNGANIVVGTNNVILTSQNIIIVGNSLTCPSQISNCVFIGDNMTLTPAGAGYVMIGASAQILSGSQHVVIGQSAKHSGANGDLCVVIGTLANVNNIDFAVCIGSTAACSGGQGNIAIGRATSVTHADAMVIGPGATSERANSCVIGSDNSGGNYQTFVFGNRGDTSPSGIADVTWRPTSAESGASANLAVGALKISGGIPLGNDATANSGEVQFFTGAPGASSSTPQTATKQFSILKSAGGAAAPNTAWDNVTTGAAAQVGTLTNAPSAGNASFWLPVRINGAVRYIPCWT